MKSVEKYNWTEGGMLEYADGKYVQHDDYAALRADLEEWKGVAETSAKEAAKYIQERDRLREAANVTIEMLREIGSNKALVTADNLRDALAPQEPQEPDAEEARDEVCKEDVEAFIIAERDEAVLDLAINAKLLAKQTDLARDAEAERDRLRNMAIRLRGCTGTCAMVSDCSAFIAAALAPQEEGK
jgi:hypothetical protein